MEHLTIKPYARLITMLGDQLIKDETIALSELIKNAYDADSPWVRIKFEHFGNDYSVTPSSKIVIEDCGCGMDEFTMKHHWLNPATPEKLLRKKQGKPGRTPNGRILQGEKGIGRFSVFKLGRHVSIVSRRRLQSNDASYLDEAEQHEHVLIYDFSVFDDNFLTENGTPKELYLSDLSVRYDDRDPEVIVGSDDRPEWGTRIEISDLRGVGDGAASAPVIWSERKVQRVWHDVRRMLPLFQSREDPDFQILFFRNGQPVFFGESDQADLLDLLETKSVLQVKNGHFDQNNYCYSFTLNDTPYNRSLIDESQGSDELLGLRVVRDYLAEDQRIEQLRCGDFDFEFYVFDFAPDQAGRPRYQLSLSDKQLVRSHRTYLYRDGIRVMPYGDPSDDWLNIDIIRGSRKASAFLSNDQLVGCVYISHDKNPGLRDKTNREGLIEEDGAARSFILLIQFFLQWLRAMPYGRYLAEKGRRKQEALLKAGKTQTLIKELQDDARTDDWVNAKLDGIGKSFRKERELLVDRAAKVEDLAALGLSIDMLMHDAMISLLSAQNNLVPAQRLLEDNVPDVENALELLRTAHSSLDLAVTGLRNVQEILPSTKQRASKRSVVEAIQLVHDAYGQVLARDAISCEIMHSGPKLSMTITNAALLQIFVNLFDNACYWVATRKQPRLIRVEVDGTNERIIFTDNGPGISDLNRPYIFDAYYSGKGEDGRGLGLYIVRTLLARYGYSIELAEQRSRDGLSGATFIIDAQNEG